MRIAERGRQVAAEHLVGRYRELDDLGRLVRDETPYVAFIHGVAGIGKSSLLAAFAGSAREHGAMVLQLDCRALEPTDRGVLEAVGAALGQRSPSLESVAARRGRLWGRGVQVFDH